MLVCLCFFKTVSIQANAFKNTSIPQWMHEQITEDLAPFKSSDVSQTRLNELIQSTHTNGNPYHLAKFTIKNQKLQISHAPTTNTGFLDRLRILKIAFKNILKNVKIPDVAFIVSMHDSLNCNFCYPIFSFAKNLLMSSGIVLMPDFEALAGYDNLLQEVSKGNALYPWSKKVNRLLWKGSMTGGHFTLDNFLDFPRTKIITLSLASPSLIEACYTSVCQCDHPELIKATFPQYFGASESISSQIKYKYQMLIDGNSAAYSRAYWQLFSNSVIFKQESNEIQWYSKGLQPYIHYVPVDYDLNDVIEKIHWAMLNEHQIQLISQNARNFAYNNLSYSKIIQYLQLLLIEYAALQKP